MIDLNMHFRIFDDVDKTVESLVGFAQRFKNKDVDTIVVSPNVDSMPDQVDKFDSLLREIIEKSRLKYDKVKFVKGINFKLSGFNDYSKDFKEFNIENTDFISLELSYRPVWSAKYISRVDDFANLSGLTPIISSIECYPAVHKNPAVVQSLIDNGCLISVSVGSLFFKKNRKLALKLIGRGMVDCLISGEFENFNEGDNFKRAYELIERKFGKSVVEKLQVNSRKVLKNSYLERNDHKPVKKFLFWYI